jgi:hypothetical protein
MKQKKKKATKPGDKTAPHLWKHIKEFFLLAQSVRIVLFFFFLTLSLWYNRTFVNWAWVTHLQFAIDLGHRVWINSKSIIRQLKQVFVLYNNNNGFFILLFFVYSQSMGIIRKMKINNQLTGRLEQPFTLDRPDCRARLVAPAAWCKWIPTLALNTHTHEQSHAQRENPNKINSSYRVKWRHL